jgi:hypothetical protein
MPGVHKHIDDQTAAYVLAAQPCFEDLKQVAAQLAGLLVLEASGSRNATPDHPMLASAEQAYRNAADGLRSARVPARARMHHDHLLTASAKLQGALRSMRASADPLALIEGAYADLRSASRTLPGFQMISFERGCCAAREK